MTRTTVRSPALIKAVEVVLLQLEPPLAMLQLRDESAPLTRTVKVVVEPAALAFHRT